MQTAINSQSLDLREVCCFEEIGEKIRQASMEKPGKASSASAWKSGSARRDFAGSSGVGPILQQRARMDQQFGLSSEYAEHLWPPLF